MMSRGVIIVSVYRKHEEKKEEFMSELKERLRRAYQRYENPQIIILGDFNDPTPRITL